MTGPSLFLIAGEPSGDALGAALMAGLRDLSSGDLSPGELSAGLRLTGVGGPLMEGQGLASLFPMEELSVMGLLEVLPKLPRLKARIRQTADAVLASGADALVTIDSPDFCLRVAGLVRASRPEFRTIHYVAPTVWAWRPGRAAKMAPVIDHVLALFPFEPPLMEAAGMSCDFVGHPAAHAPRATPAEAAAFRATNAIPPDAPLLLLLPGSRMGEVTRLLPRFRETLALLRDRHPGVRAVLPTVRGTEPMVRKALAAEATAPLILTDADAKRAAFAAADLALAASGTVSLELARNRVPMVIGHDFNRLTFTLMRRAALIDTVTLVNIVSDTRAVPEFLGPACRPPAMAGALDRILSDPDARAVQRQAADLTMARLGEGDENPGLRAARSVLAHI